MSISLDRNVGAATGLAAGGATGWYLTQRLLKSPTATDVASVTGTMVGERLGRLPKLPGLFTGIAARRAATAFINEHEHLRTLSPLARDFLIDGVATRIGTRLNDPNAMLDAMQEATHALTSGSVSLISKRFPGVADDAQRVATTLDDALKLTREQGVRSVNAMTGARAGRSLLRAIPIAGAVTAGLVGAVVGMSLLTPAKEIGLPSIDITSIPLPDWRLQRDE